MNSKKTILIVDDDPDCSIYLDKIISHYGYITRIANSGKSAIEIFDKEVFDGVFLDISLPDIDGFQVAKYIKSKKKEAFPIIAVTGLSQETLKLKEPNIFNSISAICEKPAKMQTIFNLLQKYINATS